MIGDMRQSIERLKRRRAQYQIDYWDLAMSEVVIFTGLQGACKTTFYHIYSTIRNRARMTAIPDSAAPDRQAGLAVASSSALSS